MFILLHSSFHSTGLWIRVFNNNTLSWFLNKGLTSLQLSVAFLKTTLNQKKKLKILFLKNTLKMFIILGFE